MISKIILILVTLLTFTGCESTDENGFTQNEIVVNNMVKPVYIAGISAGGAVTLRDATSMIYVLSRNSSFAATIEGSYEVGDIFLPKVANSTEQRSY